MAELFLAHFVQSLYLLTRESSDLLHQLLLPIIHSDTLLLRIDCTATSAIVIDVDIDVNVAVVDEHGLTCRVVLASHHLRVLVCRLVCLGPFGVPQVAPLSLAGTD